MSLINQDIIKPLVLILMDSTMIHTIFMFLLPFLFAIILKNEMIQEIEDKIVY